MYVLSASIRKAISKSMQRITKDESGMRPTAVSSARNEKEYESTPFLFQRQQQYGTIQLSSK